MRALYHICKINYVQVANSGPDKAFFEVLVPQVCDSLKLPSLLSTCATSSSVPIYSNSSPCSLCTSHGLLSSPTASHISASTLSSQCFSALATTSRLFDILCDRARPCAEGQTKILLVLHPSLSSLHVISSPIAPLVRSSPTSPLFRLCPARAKGGHQSSRPSATDCGSFACRLSCRCGG